MTDSADAVAVAERLLALVKSFAAAPAESKEAYTGALDVQRACDELLRTVVGPLEYTVLIGESCQESQALHLVTQLGVADIIGDGSASLAQLSERTGADKRFLGVAMGCMLGRGYFVEDAPQVYKNNPLSDVLREAHPTSMKSAVGFICDEGYNAASKLQEAAKSQGQLSGSKLAFGFQGSVFEWMAAPEHAWRGERLGRAMKQLHMMANANVPKDFEWHTLRGPVVDCGGGIGALEMELLKYEQNRELEFVIFDIPKTVENAKKVWAAHPRAASVGFAAGDFLAPDVDASGLPKGSPTYLIRHVLHDWTDSEVVHILRNVRDAMAAASGGEQGPTLLVCEMLLRPDSSRFVRTTSMQLLALNNGITRTQDAMIALLEQAGLEVKRVHHMRAVDSIIEAVLPTRA